jgi:hypothetical protein
MVAVDRRSRGRACVVERRTCGVKAAAVDRGARL